LTNIFLDTNIFISAFFFDGNERKIIRYQSKDIKYFTSEQVIDEINTVLINKFNIEQKKVSEFLAKIMLEFTLVAPDYNIDIIIRDEKDTNILKSALAANCKYLIMGDQDLLVLKKIENTQIITSKQLIDELKF
jgi:putative PIN family toxin of toxin-antitoxin system